MMYIYRVAYVASIILIAMSTYVIISDFSRDEFGGISRQLSLFSGILFLSSALLSKWRHNIIIISSALIIFIEAWAIWDLWLIHEKFVIISDGRIGPFLYGFVLQLLIISLFAINILGAKYFRSN